MKLSILVLTVPVLASFAAATRMAAHEFKLVPITYVGPITPGGPNFTITGTPKQIYDQIIALNPKYDVAAFNLEKRDFISLAERSPTRVACNVERGAAQDQIVQGIAAIINLGPGSCYLGPKPACTRLYCSQNSAIYFCNDNTHAIGPSCDYLGYGMTQDILNQCSICGGSCALSGQAWDEDNYNVIVGGSNNFGEGYC
ncbi:hypothetical protein M413DRAFT_191155 [Hebeloma cylindrosporum]|uniref:Uncharacterized protein n=1 Tax=Hebeloma cylindrosporum TaxID=76867 RepID=A0A0C3C5A3_HEBCY|nr:hypothetical protein M413DRAFT_191155 [Hebeloma cylindrosporum h7]